MLAIQRKMGNYTEKPDKSSKVLQKCSPKNYFMSTLHVLKSTSLTVLWCFFPPKRSGWGRSTKFIAVSLHRSLEIQRGHRKIGHVVNKEVTQTRKIRKTHLISLKLTKLFFISRAVKNGKLFAIGDFRDFKNLRLGMLPSMTSSTSKPDFQTKWSTSTNPDMTFYEMLIGSSGSLSLIIIPLEVRRILPPNNCYITG